MNRRDTTRAMHETRIVQFIIERGPMTSAELVEALGLSYRYIGLILTGLVESGALLKEQEREGAPARWRLPRRNYSGLR